MKTKNQSVKEKNKMKNTTKKNMAADNAEITPVVIVPTGETQTKDQAAKAPSNLVVLTGHLGKDPVINEFEGGRKKAFFTMATNIPHFNKAGAEVEETAWHSMVAWGKLAEKVQTFLRKGDKVSITGRLNYHNYTDKTGVKKIFTEIIMNTVEVIQHRQVA